MNSFYHYTYEILDIQTNLRYIGVRTSKIEPHLDLGIIYFSSSSNKRFLKHQKQNPDRYIYSVLTIFDDRKSAVLAETLLLKSIDARESLDYYNGKEYKDIPFVHESQTKLVTVHLGRLIKISRREHNKSQQWLANELDVSRVTVHKMENGDTQVLINTYLEAIRLVGIELLTTNNNIINISQLLNYISPLI